MIILKTIILTLVIMLSYNTIINGLGFVINDRTPNNKYHIRGIITFILWGLFYYISTVN